VDTPKSLLERAQKEPSGPAWQRLVDLYSPLIDAWSWRE
jgi:hypothetical protein